MLSLHLILAYRKLDNKKQMDKRFTQANKEALWSLSLTFAYFLCWYVTAYHFSDQTGVFSLPIWFELSCIFVPLCFIFLCYLMIKYCYKKIPLDIDNAD